MKNTKSPKKSKTIVYVNFSPYTNSGHFLDFLLDQYSTVIAITLLFHSLGKAQEQPNVTVYQQKKPVYTHIFWHMALHPYLSFFLLPIRSMWYACILFWYLFSLKSEYGPYETYITVNAFTAWCGNVLRFFGVVDQTIYWVWDYYPPNHSSSIISVIRRIYWYFDTHAVKNSSRVVFLSPKIASIHTEAQNLQAQDTRIVGIGTNPPDTFRSIRLSRPIELIFFGVIKKSEGLDVMFDALQQSVSQGTSLRLHVIGGGPDFEYFQKKSQQHSLPVVFHGFVKESSAVDDIISSCHIGVATYLQDKETVTTYTDPSKIKLYIGLGIPVITTPIILFGSEIKKYKAGVIVPSEPKKVQRAIDQIVNDYGVYRKGARDLARKYNYRALYQEIISSAP
jgi:glycosyltransferase involved in cell wall biosynthesis